MNTERIKQLKAFLEEDPNDAFTKYALAMEHLEELPSQSLELFEDLLKNHPDYIGTYYHAAALMAEMDMRERAEETYKKGITTAQNLGDHHALRELQTAYTNFQFDE